MRYQRSTDTEVNLCTLITFGARLPVFLSATGVFRFRLTGRDFRGWCFRSRRSHFVLPVETALPECRDVVLVRLGVGRFAPKMLVKSSVDISGRNFSASLRPAVCFGNSKRCFGGIRSSVFKRFEGL